METKKNTSKSIESFDSFLKKVLKNEELVEIALELCT